MKIYDRSAAIAEGDGGNDDMRRLLEPLKGRNDGPPIAEAGSRAETQDSADIEVTGTAPSLSLTRRFDAPDTNLGRVRPYAFDLFTASILLARRATINGPALIETSEGAPIYRWRPQGRHGVSHRHVRDGEYADELGWYRTTIGKEPSIVPLPPSERYRGDFRWQPVEPAGGRPVWLR